MLGAILCQKRRREERKKKLEKLLHRKQIHNDRVVTSRMVNIRSIVKMGKLILYQKQILDGGIVPVARTEV